MCYSYGKTWNSMHANFFSNLFESLYISRLFYLCNAFFNDKGHSIVLTASRCRPLDHGYLSGAHRIPWTRGFTHLRFPSWGAHRSSQNSIPQIHWLPRISSGLEPQWLGGWYLVGQIPSGQYWSWTRVWSPINSWWTHLSVCLSFYMASCGTS